MIVTPDVIIGVDPAPKESGIAWYLTAAEEWHYTSGTLGHGIGDAFADMLRYIPMYTAARAVIAIETYPNGGRFRTQYSATCRWREALTATFARRYTLYEIPVATWRAKAFGNGRMSTQQAKQTAMYLASRIVKKEVTNHNEAEAICIANIARVEHRQILRAREAVK